jgi:hypothetical protein
MHAGFLVLPMDHLNEMDAQHCDLVQKQVDDNKNVLSPHTYEQCFPKR